MRFGNRTSAAKGFAYSDDSATVKIAVAMPRESFNALREKAIAKGWSISEVIREYVNVGIIIDREMEEDWTRPPICEVDLTRAPGLQSVIGIKKDMT